MTRYIGIGLFVLTLIRPAAADVSGASIGSPLISSRGQHVAVTGVDGRIYLFGGFVGGTASNSVHVYDPAADTFSLRASMPITTRGACGGLVAGGRIVIVGGWDAGNIHATQI